jgi:triphosphoribosyl-dephospho-CoA synthase
LTGGVESALGKARAAFLDACELDVAARKPGNVSVASGGHGMDAGLFITAAKAAVEPLFARGTSVGTRIERAVAASRAATGCNVNLGIVLLCAPVAAAREWAPGRAAAPLRAALERVLQRLDVEDARATFRAIAHANPGGLGRAVRHDVRMVPTVDLRTAMRAAADRDSVARQYANGYADVFDVGLPVFGRESARLAPERAMLAAYLAYLRGWPDSHVARKHGLAVARALSVEAAHKCGRRGSADAGLRPEEIVAWDADLKSRGINPGTSADLTVVTAFIARLTGDP